MLAAPAQIRFRSRETTGCRRDVFEMRIGLLFAKLRVAGMDRVVIPAMVTVCKGKQTVVASRAGGVVSGVVSWLSNHSW